MEAMQISRTGLDVEWQRLQVIAQNLANMNTVRTGSGGAYHPTRLVSGPVSDFADVVATRSQAKPEGVKVLGVSQVPSGVRRVHEPGNPMADADGFVSYPALDHAGEMALLLQTSRAYEANLTAMNLAHQMYSRALDLGHQA